MWKEIVVVCLILSIVFISGCTQSGQQTQTQTKIEEQAASQIDQELNNAIENMTAEDLENALFT